MTILPARERPSEEFAARGGTLGLSWPARADDFRTFLNGDTLEPPLVSLSIKSMRNVADLLPRALGLGIFIHGYPPLTALGELASPENFAYKLAEDGRRRR